MKRIISLLVLALAATSASAQFAPNQVLRSADLNAALAGPTITSGTINGARIGTTNPTTVRATTVESTVTTGTAPFIVASTTLVPNLHAATAGSIDSVAWASPGTIGSTTPNTGAFTTLSATGQITSTVTTGTAPFVVSSTTNVPNLNASSLSGATFAAPGAIGGGTAAAGTFTTVNGNTITTGTGTLTLGAGKTTTFNHTSTYTTTDGATYTFPGATSTLARTDAGNAFVGANTFDTSVLNIGSNQVYKDASGLVGFGKTPGFQLDVASALTGTTVGSNVLANFESQASGRDAEIRFGDTVNSSKRIGYLSGAMYFATGTTENMRIDTSGNLGVGTGVTVSAKLHVAGSQIRQNDATNTYGYVLETSAATSRLKTLFGGSSFAVQTNASGTDQFLIDSSGNIAIGLTTANYGGWTKAVSIGSGTGSGAYEIVTANDTDTGNIGGIDFINSGYASKEVAQITSLMSGSTSTNRGAILKFATKKDSGALTEAMRIENAQNVVINGTSASARLTIGTAATGATLNDIIYLGGYSTTAQLRYTFNHAGSGTWGIGSDGVSAMIFGKSTAGGNGAVTNTYLTLDASGNTVIANRAAIGGSISNSVGLNISNNALTGATQYGLISQPTGTSAGTGNVISLYGVANSAATSYTVGTLYGLFIDTFAQGAGSTVSNTIGVNVQDQTVGAANYGAIFGISSGSSKWNIYASGTANSALRGNVRIGSTTAPTVALDVTGTVNATTFADDAGNLIISSTNPTIASGFGTSPSITANNTAAFKVTVGSSPGGTGVITLPTAPNGWAVTAVDVTNNATIVVSQTATSTTSATVAAYARTTGIAGNFTASDVILIQATAY